jgi:hypothetical protein
VSTQTVTPLVIAGALLGLGLVVGGGLVGNGVINARVGDRAVTVRGLAEKPVKADLAILPLRFTASGDDLTLVQSQIDADTTRVREFLKSQGYKAEEIETGRLEVADTRSREYQTQAAARYILAQTLIVRTTDVDRVTATTRALGELVRQGVVLQDFQGPTYSFTKLNDIRPSMIAEATASARSGAAQFAKDSGTNLGPIKQATQGSFEIQARDEAAPGGEGGSVMKKVRVVTTVTYQLK